MRIPWLAREYERTCQDCGYVWRVPRAVARPQLQNLRRGGRSTSGGLSTRGNVGARVRAIEAVVEANAALGEIAAAARRCARCESRRFKQRRIRS